jgi:hypothetical protein
MDVLQQILKERNENRCWHVNIQNAKSNDLYLKQTLKRCDILCVQEHWLFSFEKDILMNISKNHEYRAKCVVEETETE